MGNKRNREKTNPRNSADLTGSETLRTAAEAEQAISGCSKAWPADHTAKTELVRALQRHRTNRRFRHRAIYFKELAHMSVRSTKSKTHRAALEAEDGQEFTQ